MAPPGLSALGAKGSVRDRLTPPGRVEGSALGSYIVSLRWRGTAPSAPFFIPPLAVKTIQPPCGRGNATPLWWLAPPPSPHFVVGLWVFSHGAMSLQESIERFILPPEQGEVRRSRIGGGERSEPIRKMLIMPYDTARSSRNADFISIAAERQSATLGPKGRQT